MNQQDIINLCVLKNRERNKIYVTPGIRTDDNTNDHHKVITPQDAVKLGSSYLVIGRCITESLHPNKQLEKIINSL